MNKPSLTVVTGRPGSGKTTLVRSLARAIRCPAISRDEIKEGRMHGAEEAGSRGEDIGLHVYQAFFDTVNLLLSHGVSLIAEAAFQHKLWAPKLEPLRQIAQIRIVICAVTPELARQRVAERARIDPAWRRFHGEPTHWDYDPPHMDVPTLTVDTSDGYQPAFQTVVEFAASSLSDRG
jgi:predicted kinase